MEAASQALLFPRDWTGNVLPCFSIFIILVAQKSDVDPARLNLVQLL